MKLIRKAMILSFLMICVALVPVFSGGDEEEGGSDMMGLEGYQSVTESGVNVQWMVEGDTLHIQVTAKTTGWVAVGFDPSNMMQDANILIGYVADGKAFVRDDYGVGKVKHGPDTENGGTEDVSDISGSEEDGVTTLSYTIPLNSGDSKDKPLEAGKKYKVIVATGPDGKDDFGTYHTSNRGSVEITL